MIFLPKYNLILFCLIANAAIAKSHFTWTPQLKKAYQLTTSLRFVEAEKTLHTIAKEDPGNLLRLHVENYLDFFRVYINEENEEFNRLEKNKDWRLKQIEENGDPSSPYYLFLQADIRLQWALARLKFEEYATAFFETNKAFKLLTKNDESFPDFLPNKKNLGILHAMIGTIPDNYKWAVEWFSSMEGTIEQGKGELEEVIDFAATHEFIYETEIYVYYAYLLLHLGNEKEAAWRIIKTANLDAKNNPIACFLKANVAMRTDKGDEAIAILENKPQGPEYHAFYYLDYMLGLAKLQRLDLDAHQHLIYFVDHFNGRNFIKDAYQKLAWHELLEGNKNAYDEYMNLCKTRGYNVVGSDQHAYNEARKNEVPHVVLLKARLLFDGGRFIDAMNILKSMDMSISLTQRYQLERSYRLGRVLQKLNRGDEAINHYQFTIENGSDEPWYYACRSALEQGHIHEKAGRKSAAIASFKNCLTISPEDHKTGLHQQAKAGLRRLEN